MPIDLSKREYRKIDIRNIETRTEDDGRMIVEGYATTFNQPYTLMQDKRGVLDEQMDRSAFDGTDMSDTIMQYDHAGRVFARVKNNTLEITPDEHGLRIRAYLGGTEIGRQLYEEIAGGYTDKMSFGFTVEKDEVKRGKTEDGRTKLLRTIKKIGKLFDVSAVSLPANDATEISARNIGDGLIAEVLKEVQAEEERQRRIGEIRKILKREEPNHDE